MDRQKGLDGNGPARPGNDLFGVIDIANLVNGLGLAEIPVVNVIVAVVLLPFMAIALIQLVARLAHRLAFWLDYRIYL